MGIGGTLKEWTARVYCSCGGAQAGSAAWARRVIIVLYNCGMNAGGRDKRGFAAWHGGEAPEAEGGCSVDRVGVCHVG